MWSFLMGTCSSSENHCVALSAAWYALSPEYHVYKCYMTNIVQGPKMILLRGLVKFVPAVAHHLRCGLGQS